MAGKAGDTVEQDPDQLRKDLSLAPIVALTLPCGETLGQPPNSSVTQFLICKISEAGKVMSKGPLSSLVGIRCLNPPKYIILAVYYGLAISLT